MILWKSLRLTTAGLLSIAVSLGQDEPAEPAAAPEAAGAAEAGLAWPRTIAAERGEIVVYQPQLESFEGIRLTARSAVSVKPKGADQPLFGAVWFDARVDTDRSERTVVIQDLEVSDAKFPGATPDQLELLEKILETEITGWNPVLSLDRLLTEYLSACRGRGDAKKSLEEKKRALDWFLGAVGERNLASIRADEVDVRLGAETEAGASARTVNLKLEAGNAFLIWCVRNGRLAANPLRVLQKRNQVTDRRRPRRVLNAEETQRLIAVARVQAAEVSGAETWPLWYLFPLLAGLRRSDMVRMRWTDLDLDATPATLTIRGGKAKRRVDVLPLHPDLVRELRAVRPRTALPSAAVFPTAVTHSTRRADFKRAKIVPKTESGHADLHALRHTYGTQLAERGAPPATLQRLMRHASIQMTMAYYVHLDTAALQGGLDLLPGVEVVREPRQAEAR